MGGFSLAELTVTVALMGALAAVALPKFSALTERSQEEVNTSKVEAIRETFFQYYFQQHMIGNPHFPDPPSNNLMDVSWADAPIPSNTNTTPKTPGSLFSDGKIPNNSRGNPFWYDVTIVTDSQGITTYTMVIKDTDSGSPTFNKVWTYNP